MRKYKIKILQMLLMSALIILYYLSVVSSTHSIDNITKYSGDISIKYGKSEETFIEAKSKNSKVYYADKNLSLIDKVEINDTIHGDTITSTKNTKYYNNFNEIAVVKNGLTKSYTTKLDNYLQNIIYSKQIKISDVYAKDDYYHSIANVKLESTINYQIDASIITQIKNGKRHDILVYEAVQAVTYDEINDQFTMFYISSAASNTIANYNELVSSKLIWNEEKQNYEQSKDVTVQGHKLSDLGVSYITPYTDDSDQKINIVYSKSVGLSDREILTFYHGVLNNETGIIEQSISYITKDVPNEATLSVLNAFELNTKLYIFFSDMKYNEFNFNDNTSSEFIITNTGILESINYSHDNKNVYVLYSTSKTISLAKLEKGILTEVVETNKSDLKVGVLNYNKILEFDIAKK